MKRNAIIIIPFALLFAITGCQRRNLEKGEICLRLGDYPSAIAFFSDEVKRRPDSYEARLGLGKALLQKACDADTAAWKGACIQLEAARTLSPESDIKELLSDVYLERAHQLLSDRDSIAALDALSRAIEINNRALEPLNLAGIVYFRMGEADKSEILFRKAVALDSANAAAHFNLGMVYWQARRFRDAHAQWFLALAASPGDKDMLYWFALAEKKLREEAP
ncbi:MAG TPA: tetratricopeptide repeat protein [Chitinivibrionales bacterium]|nr:tetratricopeptide repeat protein [Chitinivibrionales bacterium]